MRRRAWNPADHPRDSDGRFRNGWAHAAAGRLPAPGFNPPPGRLGDKGQYPAEQADVTAIINDGDGWWKVQSRQRQGRGRIRLGLTRLDGSTAEREYADDDMLHFGTGRDLAEQTRDWGRTAVTGADAKEMGRFRKDATVKTYRRLTRREKSLKDNQIQLDAARSMLADSQEYWRGRGQRAGYKGDELERFVEKNIPVLYQDRIDTLEQHRADTEKLTHPSYDMATDAVELTVKPDPKRPLALYGNLIKYGGGRAPLVQARALSRIPVEFHYKVAQHMAGKDTGGMHLVPRSSGEVWEFNHRYGDEAPRGWHSGATWQDVDGVYSANERLLISGWGPTKSHKRVEETTTHEFGHALDAAMGHRSLWEDWDGIYNGIVYAGGKAPGFNPYFEQEGHAGREEFWAESFGAWTRATAKAAEDSPKNSEGLRHHYMMQALQVDYKSAQTLDYYFQEQQKYLKKMMELETADAA